MRKIKKRLFKRMARRIMNRLDKIVHKTTGENTFRGSRCHFYGEINGRKVYTASPRVKNGTETRDKYVMWLRENGYL